MFQTFLEILLPHLLEVVGIVLTLLLGWIATSVRRRWGIEIEARHREALHSAIMTGVRLVATRNLSRSEAIELAIGYTQDSVPDAIRALKPKEHVLRTIAQAKFTEIGK